MILFKNKGIKIIKDRERFHHFMARMERKLTHIPGAVGQKLSNLPMLLSLCVDYVSKEYSEIPIATILSIVGASIYILAPVDLLPDMIPALGYLDDVAILGIVMAAIQDDVDEYRQWLELRALTVAEK